MLEGTSPLSSNCSCCHALVSMHEERKKNPSLNVTTHHHHPLHTHHSPIAFLQRNPPLLPAGLQDLCAHASLRQMEVGCPLVIHFLHIPFFLGHPFIFVHWAAMTKYHRQVAYKQQKFGSYNSRDWKPKLRVGIPLRHGQTAHPKPVALYICSLTSPNVCFSSPTVISPNLPWKISYYNWNAILPGIYMTKSVP